MKDIAKVSIIFRGCCILFKVINVKSVAFDHIYILYYIHIYIYIYIYIYIFIERLPVSPLNFKSEINLFIYSPTR